MQGAAMPCRLLNFRKDLGTELQRVQGRKPGAIQHPHVTGTEPGGKWGLDSRLLALESHSSIPRETPRDRQRAQDFDKVRTAPEKSALRVQIITSCQKSPVEADYR